MKILKPIRYLISYEKNLEPVDGYQIVMARKSPTIPYKFAFKPVLTYAPREQKARLFRLLWAHKEGPGPTREGYAARFSVGLQHPSEYGWGDVCGEDSTQPPTRKHWRLKALGLVLHYSRHYGGWPT